MILPSLLQPGIVYQGVPESCRLWWFRTHHGGGLKATVACPSPQGQEKERGLLMQRTRIGRRCWWGGILALCLALLLSAVALVPAVAHAQSGNLFSNPGFETGSLSPWVIGGAGCGTPTLDTSNPHSGAYDAKIGSGFCWLPTLTQAVPLMQGATYTVSGWTRGGALQCKLGYGSDSHLANATFGSPTTVSTNWSQVNWTFSYAGASERLYVGMWCALQRGYQYYDDLSLISSQALGTLLQHSSGPAGKQIDWAHPVRVHVMPAGHRSGLASELAPGEVPLPLASPQANTSAPGTLLSNPQANFPGTCYQLYAYYVGINGVYIWTATFGHLEAWVAYMWCPQFAGDQAGMNWAFGRSYILSGCDFVFNGENTWGAWAGADLIPLIGNSLLDGVPYTDHYTCAPTFAWDDSLTANGSATYSVEMKSVDASGDEATAYSPFG